MILFKRNAQGKPILWEIYKDALNKIIVRYGLVGREGHSEVLQTNRKIDDEIASQIKAKRKEGYKTLEDLYDNSPFDVNTDNLLHYLNTYLPKFNTHEDGKFIPMLCKTLEDNKPFTKGSYLGQWKINGERCIISMVKDEGLFGDYHLNYRSREGVDWTSKLNYLDAIILPCIPDSLKQMMLEEGVALDGELYLPGYGINEINSFIKNTEVPQHYKLQFWCYDICIEHMAAYKRQELLFESFLGYLPKGNMTKATHLNNQNRFVLLPNTVVSDINEAILKRDLFISLGFEGLVIREHNSEYQFGGKRNNSMLKFKKKQDGLFTIIDIIPEGIKRSHLPKFILRNDINDNTFECTINKPQNEQEQILVEKDKYLKGNYLAFVEYRERSGITQVPFHAKVIKLVKHES